MRKAQEASPEAFGSIQKVANRNWMTVTEKNPTL